MTKRTRAYETGRMYRLEKTAIIDELIERKTQWLCEFEEIPYRPHLLFPLEGTTKYNWETKTKVIQIQIKQTKKSVDYREMEM